ncbi:MAG: hypothetical protein JW993_19185 [Sedimentisphaerales bacterium]|nr:hypothetical protein [Sedimentisphaerales bacterium]
MNRSMRNVVAFVVAVLVTVAGVVQSESPAQAAQLTPLRVDVSPDFRRNDTGAPNWQEWQVPNGRAATRKFGSVSVTLRQGTASGSALEGQWYKKALAAGACMACDGVFVTDGAIEVVLEGLEAGPHTLVTYHNSIWDGDVGPYTVSVDGEPQVRGLVASCQVTVDDDVASAFVAFEARPGQPVVVRVESEGTGGAKNTILNAFEIDAQDPRRQACKPAPFHGDLHADGDSGAVQLSWTPAAGAVRHRVYVASNRDPEVAASALAVAEPSSSLLVDTVESARCSADIVDNDSLLHYCWRVDEIDANGRVALGDIWSFRVRHLAFPGAEGYGRFALGGRGGRVYHVTNLNDSGPGSLREAVEAEGPRTVVFDVSGLISLESKLVFHNPFLTVAGQTAPGKGICIRNYTFGGLGASDTIIRHVRLRLGNLAGKTMDGMGLAASDHCIIDHCSLSWTQDETFSSRAARNITLQRCLISEALNIAGHANYEPGKQHGYAASIGGDIGSFHHNLLAHCAGRNWSLAGGLDKAGRHTGDLDIRNNVVYNWGHRTTDGGAKEVQFVNNYYKPGPASTKKTYLTPQFENPAFGPQQYYVEGNIMAGISGPEGPKGPFAGMKPQGRQDAPVTVDSPFFPPYVTTHSAQEAYESVLADVGCNVPVLDDHDKRVIEETRNGTVTYKGNKSGLPGLPDSQEDVGSWEDYPEIRRPADWDTDGDGMPGAWEEQHGSDPDDPADGAADADADGYTNLEEYLNWLAAGGKLP